MTLCEKYGYQPEEEVIERKLNLIAAGAEQISNVDVLKKCFSIMDLTTLRSNDTAASVKKLTDKVALYKKEYPDYPLPASICVYSNFASVVKENRVSEDLHVTCVSGVFPSSQSFLEVKVKECEMAVEAGADEIDIVLALNSFLAGDMQSAAQEISAIRAAIDAAAEKLGKKVVLKVILETGLLVKSELIAEASFLAMENGADFIKTSTGKVEVNATPRSAFIMCESIAAFYKKTGKKVGFKAAGGISATLDALCYYSIVKTILGNEWLDARYFRFGVSRLANNLLSSIEQKTVSIF